MIPLGLAISIGGGALWLGNTYALVSDNSRRIAELSQNQTAYNLHLIDIKSELAEIRGELKRIKN